MRGKLYESSDFKPVFSGHETFPLRYGWLKKTYEEVSAAQQDKKDARDVFNNLESISSFGVGKNMVSSMRHWATYTGVLQANLVTNDAIRILSDDGLDPWMEHPTTLWLLHWNLARQPSLVTYNWFFNYYNGGTFNRQFLNEEINDLCDKRGWKKPSAMTLKRDVECFIRMYVGKDFSQNGYNDDSIESPLSELMLIKPLNKNGYFTPNRGDKTTLSAGMFLLAAVRFWQENFETSSSLSMESMLFDAESPGRIFMLDENAILEHIYKIAKVSAEFLNWSETAGMRQFTRHPQVALTDIETYARQLIKNEYLSS